MIYSTGTGILLFFIMNFVSCLKCKPSVLLMKKMLTREKGNVNTWIRTQQLIRKPVRIKTDLDPDQQLCL